MTVAETAIARVVLAGCVWLAVCLVAPRAPAQAASSDELIQQGIGLRREGKDAEALELFHRAHQANPSPRSLAQIALAEQALGRWVDAEKHLGEALAADGAWIDERRAVLEETLTEIQNNVGSLEARVNVATPEIIADGVLVSKSPLARVRLAIGAHEILVRAQGFREVVRSVEIRPHAVTREDFTLQRDRSSAPKRKVSSAASTKRGASGSGTDAPPREASASWRRTTAWIALAGAGALLAGAIAAQVVRERNIAMYNDDTKCLQGTLSRKERCGDHLSTAETAQVLAIAGYAAAGVTLGFSIGLFAFDAVAAPSVGDRRRSAAGVYWSTRW
jgi:hypothetical protein